MAGYIAKHDQVTGMFVLVREPLDIVAVKVTGSLESAGPAALGSQFSVQFRTWCGDRLRRLLPASGAPISHYTDGVSQPSEPRPVRSLPDAPGSPIAADPADEQFGDVIGIYSQLERDGADTWNPLKRDRELEYRVAAYRHLCAALRMYPGDRDQMRILDLGCGNGRSTRVFLDFGLRPDQLWGIDLPAQSIWRVKVTPRFAFLLMTVRLCP